MSPTPVDVPLQPAGYEPLWEYGLLSAFVALTVILLLLIRRLLR